MATDDFDFQDRSHDAKAPIAKAAPGSGADPPTPGAAVPSLDPLNLIWSGIKGAGKEIAQTPAPPGGTSLQMADPKGPVATWAAKPDEEHPWAEKAGRVAADLAPLAALPELDVYGMGARALNAARGLKALPALKKPLWGIDWLANAAGKGAIGGATQSKGDPATASRIGAESGVATQAIRAALAAIPHDYRLAASLPVLAAWAWSQSQNRGVEPWWMYRLMHEAVPAAAVSSFLPPGVTGALGERAAQATGYDKGNQ